MRISDWSSDVCSSDLLFHGLTATSQNRWPSLRFDAMEVNDLLSPFLVAGFYYKTFMGFPGWRFWEKRIRAAAGMGPGTTAPDLDAYEPMDAYRPAETRDGSEYDSNSSTRVSPS